MKRLSALTIGLLVSMGLALSGSAAPQFGLGQNRGQQNRDRVCVYQDIQYQGWEQCYNAGDEIANLERRNNAVSSIRISGRARVIVYEETEFRGRSAEFTTSVPDLGLRNLSGSRSWSDHIKSIRIAQDYQGGGIGGGGRDLPDRRPTNRGNGNGNGNGICVYERRDFEGREQCWDAGSDVADLARFENWSDRISSVRVFGRAVVVLYRDIGFRGGSITIDRDTPDLSQISGNGFRSWDRQASSLAVQADRPGRGRGRDRF